MPAACMCGDGGGILKPSSRSEKRPPPAARSGPIAPRAPVAGLLLAAATADGADGVGGEGGGERGGAQGGSSDGGGEARASHSAAASVRRVATGARGASGSSRLARWLGANMVAKNAELARGG